MSYKRKVIANWRLLVPWTAIVAASALILPDRFLVGLLGFVAVVNAALAGLAETDAANWHELWKAVRDA
jgi:hypothetical protein